MTRTKFSTLLTVAYLLSAPPNALSQQATPADAINNLVHPPGYAPSEYGSIPEFKKYGNGKRPLILIPGLGFDSSVFDDFMASLGDRFTMYAVTIPGYGKLGAPEMPPRGVSYGKQSWNISAMAGIIRLIEREGLKKPYVAGHFVQGTQLAISLVAQYPDIFSGLIVLGGPAKFISVWDGKAVEVPIETTFKYVDYYWGPKWFGPITDSAFDKGNYLPEIYSLDTARAAKFWQQSAAVPLPVMVRYLCEFWVWDPAQLAQVTCPMLVLRATFNERVLSSPANYYLHIQFIESWEKMLPNPLITIRDIGNAGSFVWKDQPELVYGAIDDFISLQEKRRE